MSTVRRFLPEKQHVVHVLRCGVSESLDCLEKVLDNELCLSLARSDRRL